MSERIPGIKQYFLQHSAGITFVYTNESESTLIETLTFDISGLVIEGYDSNVVEIRCQPGDTKDVQLKVVGNEGWSFNVSVSCQIE